jgi:selenide,water dikinase
MLDPVPDRHDAGPVRLTRFSSGGGCASKLSPAELRSVLGLVRGFDTAFHPDLLVGLDTSDDAAVYRISDEQAVVVSADFFTPIVDDPYEWGRVAAANALSDVYAMGGRPLLALNLVSWPREGLSLDLLARVLDGGADMVRAAGAVVAGGHSIDDTSPKYGMAVVGLVHPRQVLTNSGARPGDALVLTKPLGLGVVAAALAQDAAPADAATEALQLMTTLNDGARDAALEIGVSAATDVTGFGLLGHLREMLVASGLAARLELNRIPFIPGVRDLAGSGHVPGGTHRNHAFVSPTTDWGTVSDTDQLILADAQTSGGLLLAVEPSRAGALVAALNQRATPAAAVIGHTVEGAPGHIGIR